MEHMRVRKLGLVLVVALLLGSVLACEFGGPAAKTEVMITAPTSDAQLELGEVNVLVSASDPKGISRVELYVDGELYRTDAHPDPEGEPSWALMQTWTATEPGVHTLSVIAYNVDGVESDPWAVTVEVLEEGEAVPTTTPTSTAGPPPLATATPPPPEDTATPPPPTPTEPTGPSEPPEILYFRANGTDGGITVDPGTTVTLSWEWERAEEGYLDPGSIPLGCPAMPCTYDVSPASTTTYTLRAVNSVGTDEETVTVEVTQLPDLAVSGLVVTPSDAAWGGSVQVRFDVANLGAAPSGPYKIIWRYGAGDFDLIEENKPSLPPGSGGTVNWTLPNVYAPYNTIAAVDPFNEVEESDEGNNQEEFMVTVGPAGVDLHIMEIRLQPPSPQQGSPVMVGVRIRNRGGTGAGFFRVIWRAAGPTLGCQWNVSSLAAGDARWQQCEFTYGGWNPNYTTTGVVDVDDDVAEADETNNELVLMVNVRPD
jgi:hypothetical protein